MPRTPQWRVLDAKDNVAVCLEDLEMGYEATVAGRSFELSANVPLAHKFAIATIEKGEDVIKYGHVIGEARETIRPGDHVHIQNVASRRA